MAHQNRRPVKWISFLCLVLLLLEALTALAQTSLVRPPTRRPRNNASVPVVPTPPPEVNAAGIGTTSQGLTFCEGSAVNSSGTLENADFSGGYYVLGLVAPIGAIAGLIADSGDLISFWVVPDSTGRISMSATELQSIADAGGDLNQLLLIGALEVGNDTFVWKAIGECANAFNRDQGGEQFLFDLYTSYMEDPLTSPERPAEIDLADAVVDITDLVPFELPDNVILLDPDVSIAVTGFSEEGRLAAGSWNNSLTGNEGDIYRFYVDAGTAITVGVTSAIDTVAEIRDANGATLYIDDDSGGNLNPLIDFALPNAGDFSLVVRPYSAGNPSDYSMNVSLVAPVVASASAPTTLQPGTYQEAIDADSGDVFVFYGEAGSPFEAAVTSDLDTVAELYNDSGELLIGNDDTNGTNPYLAYTLPYSGEYTLVIYPYSSGVTGGYQLDVFFETPAVGCPNLPPPQLFVGAMVVVTPGNATRVRADTSVDSAILAQMRRNTTAQVLTGPVCANNRVWWQVNYNGVVGWSAEVDQDGEYLLMVR